jgi:hypothetical protein
MTTIGTVAALVALALIATRAGLMRYRRRRARDLVRSWVADQPTTWGDS